MSENKDEGTGFLSSCLAALVLCALLAGCELDSKPAFRVGTNTWLGYEPLYLARELGYLDSQAVHLVEYPSSSETIRAFRNHDIDAVALTLDEVLLLLQDGFDLRAILVTDISLGGDVILGRPGITSMQDLVGRRVAVESAAVGAYLLSRALELNGLTPEDVEIIQQDANEHVYTFDSDIADAVVGCEPERTELLRKGAVVLFDSAQIPGEIVDVVAVRKEDLESHAAQIRALLSAWFRAVQYLSEYPDAATERMGARMHMTQEEVLSSLKGLRIPTQAENLKLLDGKSSLVANSARKLNDMMLANRLIDARVNIDALPMPDPLKELAQ